MSRRRVVDLRLRDAHADLLRRLCALPLVANDPDHGWHRDLAALEAGEPVVVPGWVLGAGQDFNLYTLHGDGHVTPLDDERGRVAHG